MKKEEEMRKIFTVVLLMTVMVSTVLATGTKESDASTYPDKPIQMIVPYGAGGGTDNAARIVADQLSKILDQQVLVVNKPGASGEIGFESIALSEPDGYTIGVLGGPDHAYLVNIKETNYKLDDFDYLAIYNLSLPVLVARKDSFKNWDDLVAFGKANPGRITIGVSGGGPTTEAAIAMSSGGFDATIVKFSGSADVSSALLGGHIDLACLTPSYLPTLEANGATPIAYFSKEKVTGYTDIPSFIELGYNVNISHNPIFVFPKGVDPAIQEKVQSAMDQIGENPDVKAAFEKINTVFTYLSGSELTSYLEGCDQLIADMVDRYSSVFISN
jgi:tripartite-type tricarboxylate transporter receptor subunit TctC